MLPARTPKDALKSFLADTAIIWPLVVYLGLGPFLLLFSVIGGIIADTGHSGGEAVGLTFMADIINRLPHLYLAVSFLFLILIKFRNKYCLLLNGTVCALAAWTVFYFYQAEHAEVYRMQAVTTISNHDTLRTEREYYYSQEYRIATDSIRSIKHWRNGKPAGIWTTFDRQGSIIEQEHY